MTRTLFLTLTAICLGGCAPESPDVDRTEALPAHAIADDSLADSAFGARSRARLIDAHGVRIGEVFAWQGRSGVLIQVRSQGLPPGTHGVHMHAAGECSDLGAFKASGGHVVGAGGLHGFLHPAGAHSGDLPNIYVHSDGRANADYFSAALSLTDLTDQDGAALIIHAVPDDYQSQAIGAAGVRIACAAFSPKT